MHKLSVLICIIAISAISGCASFPTASGDNDTLVVGQIFAQVDKRTTYSNGINMVFTGTGSNNKSINIVAQKNGYFFTSELTSGIYTISNLSFGYGGYFSSTYNVSVKMVVVIKEKKINNLGRIVCYVTNGVVNIADGGAYSQVKEGISQQYDFVTWQQYTWEERGYPIYRTKDDNPLMHKLIVNGGDRNRYNELWAFWNMVAGQKIREYPVALVNETVGDWFVRNITKVFGTRQTTVYMHLSSPKTENSPGLDTEIPMNAYMINPENDTGAINGTLVFSYSDETGASLGSVNLAW